MRRWIRRNRHLRPLLRLVNGLVGGGDGRFRVLLRLLAINQRALLRRDWVFSDRPPHFFDQRLAMVAVLGGASAYSFYRGYYAAELVREGDALLDIGCGDGFFDKRFFAERCSRIDAIDVDEAAIAAARSRNSSPKIRYLLLDAVQMPFPEPPYDVIVWDGALGHFSPDVTAPMLEKIRSALAVDGAFVGSESLGREGDDHLQFFDSVDDIAAVMRSYFPFVQVREIPYRFPNSDRFRREAFWRCATTRERLEDAAWH